MNPEPRLAMDLIGMPFNGTWEVSDIGLLVLACLLIMRVYGRIDKFEEILAKRLEAKIDQHAQPKGREIYPQPLVVKEEKEFTPLKDHKALEGKVNEMGERIDLGFENLRTERSRSTGNLHERIEAMSKEADARNEALRLEIKNDVRGVHNRTNEVLEAVSELRGSIQACQKIHLQQ